MVLWSRSTPRSRCPFLSWVSLISSSVPFCFSSVSSRCDIITASAPGMNLLAGLWAHLRAYTSLLESLSTLLSPKVVHEEFWGYFLLLLVFFFSKIKWCQGNVVQKQDFFFCFHRSDFEEFFGYFCSNIWYFLQNSSTGWGIGSWIRRISLNTRAVFNRLTHHRNVVQKEYFPSLFPEMISVKCIANFVHFWCNFFHFSGILP